MGNVIFRQETERAGIVEVEVALCGARHAALVRGKGFEFTGVCRRTEVSERPAGTPAELSHVIEGYGAGSRRMLFPITAAAAAAIEAAIKAADAADPVLRRAELRAERQRLQAHVAGAREDAQAEYARLHALGDETAAHAVLIAGEIAAAAAGAALAAFDGAHPELEAERRAEIERAMWR